MRGSKSLPGCTFPALIVRRWRSELIDLSAGGLSFNAANQTFKAGDLIKGRLQFVIDNLGLTMDVDLLVRNADRQTGRVGCQFQNLDLQDIAPPCATSSPRT